MIDRLTSMKRGRNPRSLREVLGSEVYKHLHKINPKAPLKKKPSSTGSILLDLERQDPSARIEGFYMDSARRRHMRDHPVLPRGSKILVTDEDLTIPNRNKRRERDEAVEVTDIQAIKDSLPSFGPDTRSYDEKLASYTKQMVDDMGSFAYRYEEQNRNEIKNPFYLYKCTIGLSEKDIKKIFKDLEIPTTKAKILKPDKHFVVLPIILNRQKTDLENVLPSEPFIPGLASEGRVVIAVSLDYDEHFKTSDDAKFFKPILLRNSTNLCLIDANKFPQTYLDPIAWKAKGMF